MSLLIYIVVVVVVLVLLLWAVHYLPMPPGSPEWIKNFLYIVLVIVAVVVIIAKSGLAHAQTRPVPQLKPSSPVTGQVYEQPRKRQGASSSSGWQRFQGATRCEQIGQVLSCDNGYRQTIR